MNGPIDYNNYEAWLLDRLEGNLTPEQERQLEAFLAANPGLDPGLDELPTFDAGDVGLTALDKDALKRELPPIGMPGDPIDDFLIAQGEGDLSPEQEEALHRYVNERPAHQRDAHLYGLAKVSPSHATLADKHTLYRQLPPTGMPAPHTLDDFLVARLEGDLAPEQERALAEWLQRDAQAAVAWQLMQQTRVMAGTAQYPHKEGLKKGGKVIAIGAARASWAVHLRVAATVAVLLGVGWWSLQRDPGPTPQLITGARPTDAQRDVDTAAAQHTAPPRQDAPMVGDGLSPAAAVYDEALLAEADTPRPALHAPQPMDAAIARESTPARLTERSALPALLEPARVPLEAVLPDELPVLAYEQEAPGEELADRQGGIPLAGFLAAKLRKRLLDEDDADTRPLDSDDAVAAADLGLRSVAGEQAGLSVRRNEAGRISGIDVRLGRNLALTAGR